MIYTKKDFIIDILGSSNLMSVEQPEITIKKYKLSDSNFQNDLNLYTKSILKLNYPTMHRDNTFYLTHKSYPSARSLYPIEIGYVLENNLVVTNRTFQKDEKFLRFDKEEELTLKNDDIIFFFSSSFSIIEKYKSIKNTLIILELGHLHFNLIAIASLFKMKYSYQNAFHLKAIKQPIFDIDTLKLQKLFDLAENRTSGPYLKYISNLNMDKISKPYLITESTLRKGLSLYNLQDEDIIKIEYYANNTSLNKFVECNSNKTISYYTLNSLYPYITFRTSSQYTLFSIDAKKVNNSNIERIILLIGFLAQDICLFNSKENYYNRPLKAVNPNEFSKIFNISKDFIPFYAVVSGYL